MVTPASEGPRKTSSGRETPEPPLVATQAKARENLPAAAKLQSNLELDLGPVHSKGGTQTKYENSNNTTLSVVENKDQAGKKQHLVEVKKCKPSNNHKTSKKQHLVEVKKCKPSNNHKTSKEQHLVEVKNASLQTITKQAKNNTSLR